MEGLKIKHVEDVLSAALGITFKKVTFTANTAANAISSAKPRVRNLWGKRTIDGKEYAADPMFDDVAEGLVVEDAYVKQFKTTGYKVDGNAETLNTATFVIFADENPYKYAALQMRDKNAKVFGEDGETISVRAKNPKKVTVSAKPATEQQRSN